MFSFFKPKKKRTESEYVEIYRKKLEKRFPNVEIINQEGMDLKVQTPEGIELNLYLGNSYGEYVKTPKNLNSILDYYMNSYEEAFAPPKSLSVSDIMPVIRNKNYLVETAKMVEGFDVDNFIYEDLNEDLNIFYMLDSGHTMTLLTRSDLKKFGVEQDDLLSIAIENLVNYNNQELLIHNLGSVMSLTYDGVYDASWIASKIWESEDVFPFTGNIVVGVPTRDRLLIEDSDNPEGVETLRNLVKEEYENGGYTISDKVFEYRDGKFHEMS